MDLKEIKKLIGLVEQANISSIKIEQDNLKVEISKLNNATGDENRRGIAPQVVYTDPQPVQVVKEIAPSSDSPQLVKPEKESEDTEGLVPVKSPMVGTFYTSPNPESKNYVSVGSKVTKGDVICIIEAMKLFNEIESEHSGTIEKILVENSSTVEYGQELFLIRTS